MAAKLLRTVLSWLGAPFQPSILPLTLVLAVLLLVAITDALAWFMVLN
jgi:hypothetical protein